MLYPLGYSIIIGGENSGLNFSRREMMILSHVYVERTRTSNDLALLLNVTVRTIKKDIERLGQ